MHAFHRSVLSATLAGCCSLLLAAGTCTAAWAATPVAKPAAKSAKTSKAATGRTALKTAPATSRQQTSNAAKGLALATETTEAINAAQLDIAARVLTGAADCEFNQKVTVQPVEGRAGYFSVTHLGRHYRMVPRETSTGAVRLEDPVNGIVWLQIPAKSMLMNAKRGQRMVDSCTQAEQRAAVAAATAAGQAIGQGIGILPQTAAVALAPAASAVTVMDGPLTAAAAAAGSAANVSAAATSAPTATATAAVVATPVSTEITTAVAVPAQTAAKP